MMYIEMYLSYFMFLMSCFMLFYYYEHLLMVLILMEFIMLSVIYNLFLICLILEINLYFILFMLVMVVCEGALGLSMVVLMVRLYGNDYLNSLSLLKW